MSKLQPDTLSLNDTELTTSTFNITYHAGEKAIFIEDKMKEQIRGLNFILGITLFNSLLNVFWIKQTDPWGIVETSWGIIGIFSLFSLIYHFRYKTSEANIPLTEIRYLKETSIIGRKTYHLKLKNGRSRNLLNHKNHAEIREMKSFFRELGIRHKV